MLLDVDVGGEDSPATPENSRTNLLINEPVVLLILVPGLEIGTGAESAGATDLLVDDDDAGDVTTPYLRWRFSSRDAFCVAFLNSNEEGIKQTNNFKQQYNTEKAKVII